MSFCTVINCMDGRAQLPVIQYMMKRTGALYVDSITAPGANGILAEETNLAAIGAIMDCITISISRQDSPVIAVAGHHDCLGNPGPKEQHDRQTRAAVAVIKSRFPDCEVLGLWVDEQRQVHELDPAEVEVP